MMKHYTITVNGTAYDVTVEEKTGVAAPASPTPAASAVSAVPVQKTGACCHRMYRCKSRGGRKSL